MEEPQANSASATLGKTEFLTDSFENLRKRLLDLSTRNSLLSYRFPRASCLRLVDELPNQLAEHLLDGGVFRLLAVPEPTQEELLEAGHLHRDEQTGEIVQDSYPDAREWARQLGFAVDYELPQADGSDEKHADENLQTLMYANELEARLRNLRSKANASIEETGSNILYLSLGFLEWYESKDSDRERIAPLYTMPVELSRGTLDPIHSVYRYEIKLKEDGLLTNIALREKLANDFAIALPPVKEEQSPEEYFRGIASILERPQPKWRIRRHAALTLLNYTKQVMYDDLDLKRWPDASAVTSHPVLQEFLSAGLEPQHESNVGFIEEYDIDHLPDVHTQYPIVFDADSSQHSALVDAINGKNLVIEGPPGTGKSQTIANLIAAAIGNGKRVLFVAEKMAALEVVKGRLDSAGLGDFCLELHSHRTNRLQILNELSRQLDSRQSQRMDSIGSKVERFESLRRKLSDHAGQINSEWKDTSLTVYSILTAAARYQRLLGKDPSAYKIDGFSGNTCSSAAKDELEDQVDMLVNVYQQAAQQAPLGRIENHPWYGVTASDLTQEQATAATNALRDWNESVERLSETATEFLSISEATESALNLKSLRELAEAIAGLPENESGDLLSYLPTLVSQHESVSRALAQKNILDEQYLKLTTNLKPAAILSGTTANKLQRTSEDLQKTGCNRTLTVADLTADAKQLTQVLPILSELITEIERIRDHLPKALAKEFTPDIPGMQSFLDTSELVESLPGELWRHRDEIYDDPDFDHYLEKVKPLLAVQAELQRPLDPTYVLANLPESQELAGHLDTISNSSSIFGWFSSSRRESIRAIRSIATQDTKKKHAINALPDLITYAKNEEALTALNAAHSNVASVFSSVQTTIDNHEILREWYRQVRGLFGLGLSETAGTGNALVALDRNLAIAWVDILGRGFKERCIDVLEKCSELNSRYPGAHVSGAESDGICDSKSALSTLTTTLKAASSLHGDILVSAQTPLAKFQQYSETLTRLDGESQKWLAQPAVTEGLPVLASLPFLDRDNGLGLQHAEKAVEIARVLSSSRILSELVTESDDPKTLFERARLFQPKFGTQTDDETLGCENFASASTADIGRWSKAGESSVDALLARNTNAISNPNWLNTWTQYIQVTQKLSGSGFHNIVASLEQGKLAKSEVKDVALMVFYHQLATEILDEHPEMKAFNGLEQSAVRDKFQEHDKALLLLQREHIAARGQRTNVPEGNASGRVAEFTEKALIRHEANKKTRHVPVRGLMRRAGNAIQSLKPCFMMSPMSVAQYLEPGSFEFDMVVMDEASQIRPEDAIGAIVRGKSLVVVGDPKQLPPTSFFQKAVDDQDTDDYTAMEEAGSILESALPIFTTRRLRWHYRSRHESLIAFSNQSFYDSNLVIFPSPKADDPEFGIIFHRIDGRFSSRRNTEEARQAIELAAETMLAGKESIAMVAMNGEQRDELELQFEQRLKDDPLLREAYEERQNSEEPVIIKNLENVQGDERDVVIISMTYGPEEIGGRTMQRFGPINSDMGWRRLNVLFTRSKKRMHICSSMDSTDVIVSDGSKRGVKALRSFLEYCETGHLHSPVHTGRPPDSDFEVAVINMLEDKGYSCVPQLGVAGYFLDIAVKDPGKPGAFLIGIECDGATYHSAKSARDRDRLRQQVLEGLGWKIMRIWSTDWFRNPEAQLMPILNELEKLRTLAPEATGGAEGSQGGEVKPEAETPRIGPKKRLVDPRTAANAQSSESTDLRTHLVQLEKEVIRPALPNTKQDSRLLRPAMLEALMNYKPRSKAEFAEVIPSYLRDGTAGEEGIYLEQALDLIDRFG